MLTVFCDDSGTDRKGPFCVIAGYISDVERWKIFANAWDDELRAAPSIAYFKMSEANSRLGQFWGWDNDARDQKVLRLVAVIKAHVIGGIASFISNRAYDSAAKGCLPATIDHPYWMCFQKVVLGAIKIYGEQSNGGKIDFVFDTQGEGFERRATQIHAAWETVLGSPYSDLMGGISFQKSGEVNPLQAADLLAWHIRRGADSAILRQPENRPAASLLWTIPTETWPWQPEDILDAVDIYQALHPQSPINRPDLH